MGKSHLDRVFHPKNVAVIGASEKPSSVGRTIMKNLSSFRGKVYPVNPNHGSIFRKKCYPDIGTVPASVDLAIIATPAHTVPGIISACAKANVSSAIIISAGFKEEGAEGVLREEDILSHARGRLRIIGPNCLGVMRPSHCLNATFAHSMALDGSIAFLSQSGALCTAVLDWSLSQNIGFSAFVSIGSMIDVGWADLIQYFEKDPLTKSLFIYMESIGDAKAFMSAASLGVRSKPIVILKSGRCAQSAKAAISHTGALVGNDEIFSAAMETAGILRVDTIEEMFSMAHFLACYPLPAGSRLTIITNAGGPGVIATDAIIKCGGKLADLSPSSIQAFDALLSPHWSQNPVDILGDAGPEKFAKAMQIAAKDSTSDGVLAILTPQDMTDPTRTSQLMKPLTRLKKPLMASWMGGESVRKGKEILSQYHIPVFDYPDQAVRTFIQLGKMRQLPQKERKAHVKNIDRALSCQILSHAKTKKREILGEFESKQILASYGIPVVRTEIAKTSDQAIKFADDIGYPVVLKIHSHTITHKSNAGGVKLHLQNAQEVKQAFSDISSSLKRDFLGVTVQPMVEADGFELILGSTIDEQFGQVVLFGFGGQLVEEVQDRALALAPLTIQSAQNLIRKTKVFHALAHKKIDLGHLEETLIRFSQLICDHSEIHECDVNPLFISKDCLLALDARIVIEEPLL